MIEGLFLLTGFAIKERLQAICKRNLAWIQKGLIIKPGLSL
jgi:hypothetical protein